MADRLARALITAGGICTILAVLGVCLFLVSQVVPLFLSADVAEARALELPPVAAPLHVGMDEQRTTTWALWPDGKLLAYELSSGKQLMEVAPFGDRTLTAAGFPTEGSRAVAGFADGSFQIFSVEFTTSFPDAELVDPALREELRSSPPGHAVVAGDALIQITPLGQYRQQRLNITTAMQPQQIGSSAVEEITLSLAAGEAVVTAVLAASEDGSTPWQLVSTSGSEQTDFGSGTQQLVFGNPTALPLAPSAEGAPDFLLATSDGQQVYLAWSGGDFARIARGLSREPFLAESGRLVAAGRSLTAMSFVVGDGTMVWGDSEGTLSGGFLVRRSEMVAPPVTFSADSFSLVRTKELGSGTSAVTALVPSSRSRMIAAGFASGETTLVHVTSAKTLARVPGHRPGAVESIAFAPREDGFAVMAGGQVASYELDLGYPEATFAALFLPVWYEGYAKPMHTWQSSSGHTSFEPKLGLMPLVFGTIKATFYSMLFGAPLALLAAIFCSEFLAPRVRAFVKPSIELMASLPSVVLGFLAAMVFAPFVEEHLASALSLLVTVPGTFLACAVAWQFLPRTVSVRLERWRLLLIVPAFGVGLLLASQLGHPIESWLFDGDFKVWLAVTPGVDAYVQRNAMIVGLVMGFAIIPIIFTIADDALTAVPGHLRSASLGAGATRWQTAMRIVIPTATSGLFSAMMIGLGRAVGETMIVLMAAGNTPVMDWNLFSGFRTLSANIAVELPEAVKGSTHYRVLFLAALVLFVMTFFINTLAELVRLRFRKRTQQL